MEGKEAEGEISYYHRDEQLSTVLLTDRRGEIQAHYQYDTVREQYYLRARYYNPVVGRFMQEDVYQGDGMNLYAYCRNHPVKYYDPSGYASCPAEALHGGDGNEWSTNVKGYSNFADGMSPEDAAKYIKNNEIKFFGEFSERASASGLDDIQISEAFEAMKNGNYEKMASYFDTSSPHSGAVFWSGNQVGAGQYAQSIGGTIMEQTPGGQVFNNWSGLGGMYPEWGTKTELDQKPIWEALSSQYANGAFGNVTYAHPSGYVGKVWEDVEFPIIKTKIKNGIVTGYKEVLINGK